MMESLKNKLIHIKSRCKQFYTRLFQEEESDPDSSDGLLEDSEVPFRHQNSNERTYRSIQEIHGCTIM